MAAIQSFLYFATLVAILIPVSAQLTPDFYDKVCPQALPIIRKITKQAIRREPRMGASLLRMHFHDCFVNVSLLQA
jgi:peroxidase